MPRVLFADSPVHTDLLCRSTGLAPGHFHERRYGSPRLLRPCVPYALGESFSATDDAILADLAPPTVAQTLTSLSHAYGGETTLALAEVLDELQAIRPSVSGYVSAAAGVASARMGRFSEAVQASQRAILDYHRASRSGHGRQAAREVLVSANEDLNQRFQYELEVARRRMSARYRALSSNEQRLADLVRHTRRVSRLDVASRLESSQLAKLGRGAHYLGGGLTALDFGSRVVDIHAEYRAGGDWTKKMFVESTSFAVSTGAGSLVASAGLANLGIAVAATPVGWVLIVVVLAAAVAGATLLSDHLIRAHAGDAYDRIMEWLGAKR